MLKAFFKDSIVYTISGILSRGVPILLLPLYTRALSTSEFGYWEYIFAIGGVVAILLPLEITQGMARYFPEAGGDIEKAAYASSTFLFTLLMYLGFFTAAALFSKISRNVLFDGNAGLTTLYLCLSLFVVNGLVNAVQNILRWNLQSVDNAIFSLMIAVVTISLSVPLLSLGYGLDGALFGSAAAGTVGLVFVLARGKFKLNGPLHWSRVRQMLRSSLPLVPSSLGVIGALYMDRLLIKNMLDMDSLAYYSVAYRVSSFVILIMVGFQGALTPLIYSNYRNPEVKTDLSKLFRIFVALALLFITGLSLFIREGINLFLDPKYAEASRIVPFLVFATLLWQMYIFAPGLSLAGKTKAIAIINLLGAALNLLLNYGFIKAFGLMGAAVATLLSALFTFGLYMYFSQRRFYVPHNWRQLGVGVALAAGLILTAFMTPVFQALPWLKIFLLAATFIVLVRLRMLGIADLKEFVFKK